MRLIDADELINKLNKFESDVHVSAECYSSVTEITETIEYVGILIDETPTVEAVPVVHGEWVNEYINRYGHPCHCCSVCGFHASHQDKNFCPECGADMRKCAI